MVKKKCTVEAGIPSQVVTATVLNKPKGLMSVATKVRESCKSAPVFIMLGYDKDV
jgi:hypothetical protein